MNRSDDPLLRATAGGDPACPDGQALVHLGRVVRDATRPPRAVDLVPQVLARIGHRDEASFDDAVDALYDGSGRVDHPDLLRLGGLVRAACDPLRRADLGKRVLARLDGADRAVSRQLTLPTVSRWRVWSSVIAGHVAALIAIAVWHQYLTAPASIGEGADGFGVASHESPTGDGNPIALPTVPGDVAKGGAQWPEQLPTSWDAARMRGDDLFRLRRDPALRDLACQRFGQAATTRHAVASGLDWLSRQQDADGRFGVASDPGRDIAVQSLAILALLGEGAGDEARLASARRGLDWLARQPAARDEVIDGLVALALVEGALWVDDDALRAAVTRALASLAPGKPGASGLGGFTLLALETASATGLAVPAQLIHEARNLVGRPLPARDDDPGRLGLALFARQITGRGDSVAAMEQCTRLAQRPPRQDEIGRIDPLGWLFATLALRESGGDAWTVWSHGLEEHLLGAFARIDDQTWVVPAARVRFADVLPANGDLFATSLVVLNLQAPYRYLPLAAP